MSNECQARVTDPIVHLKIEGSFDGALAGLVGGGLLLLFVGGSILSGGTLDIVVGAVGLLVTTTSIGKSIGEMIVPDKAGVEGHIIDGSPDTFVGNTPKKAARAKPNDPKTLLDCHTGAFVAQGSRTVFINCCSASRKGDGTSCGGMISDGDHTVFTGGPIATLFDFNIPQDINAIYLYRLNLGLDVAGLITLPKTAAQKVLFALQAARTAKDAEKGTDPNGTAGSALDNTRAAIKAGDTATTIANEGWNTSRVLSSTSQVLSKL